MWALRRNPASVGNDRDRSRDAGAIAREHKLASFRHRVGDHAYHREHSEPADTGDFDTAHIDLDLVSH